MLIGFISDSLSSGYSIDEIREAISDKGYSLKTVNQLIAKHNNHQLERERVLVNNLLAAGLIAIIILNLFFIFHSFAITNGYFSKFTRKIKSCSATFFLPISFR